MLPNFTHRVGAKSLQLIICATLALALSACGGGGGSPGATGGSGGTGGTGGVTGEPKIAMTITSPGGKDAITTLSGGQKGALTVTLTTSTGTPVKSAIVNFATSAPDLLTFDPASASALTDANGVAVMQVAPATTTSSGALSITATALVGTSTVKASTNIAVGAAPLTIGALSFSPPQTGALPAFSTVQLNIPVTSGGVGATSVSGLSMSSLCVGDGKATLVLGSLSAGVQTATYTNNGCNRGTDTITASIGSSSQSINIGVGAANIGTIQFIGTDLAGQSIVLKGSGGLGRKEAAVVTFRVVDQNNNGLAGVDVNFRATTYTGGLTVLPLKGTTDALGNVTTTVSSGTIPTPVRVIAEATRNGTNINGLSDSLIISTGLPMQRFMSLSASSYNIEGLNADNQISNITVALADQFGNKISDGTAINFVTEGGAIGSSAQGACLTVDGACTVPLKSQNFRPVNGRVTILAYVQGIEDFVDTNGDGQYTCPTWERPDNFTGPFRPLVDLCAIGVGEPKTDMPDPFLDTGNPLVVMGQPAKKDSFDGSMDPANGDKPIPYNQSVYNPAGNGRWGLNYIRATTEITFSGQNPVLIRQNIDPVTGAMAGDWTGPNERIVSGLSGTGCSSQVLAFRLADVNNNPMPKDTIVATADVDKVAPQTMSPNLVMSTNAIGGTYHFVTIKPDTACSPGFFSISIRTPLGLTTLIPFKTN
jgi:hypothetical protein